MSTYHRQCDIGISFQSLWWVIRSDQEVKKLNKEEDVLNSSLSFSKDLVIENSDRS